MKITFYITFLLFSFSISQCNFKNEPDHYPADFTFRISASPNRYDSETQIYERAYSNRPSSVKVSLTEKELQSIFEDFQKFEFFTFPEEFECEKNNVITQPSSTNVINVTYNNKSKRCVNDLGCEFKTQRTNSDNFNHLARKISQILTSKKEIKNMAKTDIITM